ncbi:unnamed protein product [Spirodela intermedia]|uniref:RRM domain-containing protein n=1 Tax=Spirodela intermedia TaxID=51605 RepID=A0A7I8JAA4_SPIIN|nr:unnamed protein product [Spirodela intermedia]CAA6666921.1 unnamed protein product [Spirodela intermedia]
MAIFLDRPNSYARPSFPSGCASSTSFPIAPADEGVLRSPIYSPQPEVILEVIPKIRHGSDKRLPPPRAICLRKRRVRIGPRWRTKMDSSGGRVRRGPKRSFSCRVGSFWLPKLRCLRKKCPDEDKLQENLQFRNGADADDGGDSRTTVMIKNLPNKMRKEALLSLLDSHCQKENGKVVHHDAVMNTRSQFDFFYLPMDFGTGSNLGYAFVNFTSAAGAWRFHRAFHQMKWSIMGSRKVCEVTYARIQGLTALMKHFRGSVFVCDNDELLPLYFVPHRDGVMQCEGHHVGRRVPPSRFGGP